MNNVLEVNKLTKKYNQLSATSGLPNRLRERTYVPNYNLKSK